MNQALIARLNKAEKVLDKAEGLVGQLAKGTEPLTKASLDKLFAPIQEAIEEAQQLLFDERDEVEDSLPDPDEEMFQGGDGASGDGASGDGANGDGANGDGANGDGANGDGANGDGANGDGASGDGVGEEIPETDTATQEFLDLKLRMEQRSRMVEAQAYELAARRLAPGLGGLGAAASEEQDKLLAFAVSALEAHFLAEPDPGVLARIAELQVMRREVKKAKAYLAKALEMEPGNTAAQDLLERIHSDPAIKDKSKCFIATAAMGSADAAEVQSLRAFRDKILLRHTLGRLLVSAYYEYSPPLAKAIEDHPALRDSTARFIVRPLAGLVRRLPGID